MKFLRSTGHVMLPEYRQERRAEIDVVSLNPLASDGCDFVGDDLPAGSGGRLTAHSSPKTGAAMDIKQYRGQVNAEVKRATDEPPERIQAQVQKGIRTALPKDPAARAEAAALAESKNADLETRVAALRAHR